MVSVLVLAACTTATNGAPSAAGTGLDCPGPAAASIVSCVGASLGKFWSQELGRPIAADVVLAPTAAEVPAPCRAAVRRETAFTCPIGNRVYLTSPYVDRLTSYPPTTDAPYRVAATLAHEMGHVLQFAVHEPLVEKSDRTAAQTRVVEQQADCLSGVWAHRIGIDDQRFLAAASQVFAIVDSPLEEHTHGTPAQREAAVRRGQAGGTAQACGLTLR